MKKLKEKINMKKISGFLMSVLYFLFLYAPVCFGAETFSLQRFVETALEMQPSLKNVRSNLNISKYAFVKSLSSLYPQLSVSSSYNYSGNSSGSGSYSAGASVSQKIYDFGRTGGAVRAAIEQEKNSGYALQLETQQVVFSVTQQYFLYLKAKHIVEADSVTLSQSEISLRQIEAFRNVGTKPAIDVARSRLDYSNNKLILLNDMNSLKLAKLNLAQAVGLKNTEFEAEDFFDTTGFNLNIEQCLEIASKQRPDLKQKEADVLVSNIQLATARSNYLPSISASGNYSYSGIEFPLDSSWGAGLNISIPIFSGFSVTSSVKTAEENYYITLNSKEQFELSLQNEIKQAYFDMKQKLESIAVAAESLEYANENFSLAQGRYLSGVGSIIELSDARASLASSKTNYIKSVYDYNISIASLKKAIGY